MVDTALSALVRAWAATVMAVFLLVAGLALASAWDGAVYIQGLQEALDFED